MRSCSVIAAMSSRWVDCYFHGITRTESRDRHHGHLSLHQLHFLTYTCLGMLGHDAMTLGCLTVELAFIQGLDRTRMAIAPLPRGRRSDRSFNGDG